MSAISSLLDVMAQLRNPEGGCPWDLEQSFASIAPYTIEEAYEVAETIAAEDWEGLRDELGDLLFQVVFYAQMAREAGLFDFDEVARGAAEKMVRRHPHVFGGATVENTAAQTHAWEAQKAAERSAKAVADNRPPNVLDGIAQSLPALSRATKLQARVARVGFDWPDVMAVFDKILEEISEVRHELKVQHEPERVSEEIGDLLFACANLARHAGVDAEAALRQGNAKFERRFRRIEARLAERGLTPEESTLAEMDALWEDIKVEERD